MRKLLIATLTITFFGASSASAEDTPPAKMGPKLAKPSAETRALLPIAVDGSWTGMVPANAMGDGAAEMPTNGSQDCKWSVDNLWLTCNIRDKMGLGKDALTWRGIITIGYDYLNKEYRASVVDNFGTMNLMTGKLDGNKLALTSVLDTIVEGKKCKGRLTFDWTDPAAIKIVSENSTDGGEFKVMEDATLRPSKKEKLPAAA